VWDEHRIGEVVHFAAETHVDRSIMSSGPFIQTNVVGTQVLLDIAKAKGAEKYLQVSTDEVYARCRRIGRRSNLPKKRPWRPESLQRQQGGRRRARGQLFSHAPHARADHAVQQ